MAARLTSPERRRAPRVQGDIPIAILQEGNELSVETKNISATGAYCTLDKLVPPMTKLQLQLELPNGKNTSRITCWGVVVRVEPVITDTQQGKYNTAIFFTDLADRDRTKISSFVRRRLAASA